MGHTEGPWEIVDEGEPQVYIYGQNGTYIAEVSSDAGLEEARTNAALIVAAPDLLEAAERWIGCLTALAETNLHNPIYKSLLNTKVMSDLMVAIAKAENG